MTRQYESRFRKELIKLEEAVREHQMETLSDYRAVYAKEVTKQREKVVKMYVGRVKDILGLKNEKKQMERESIDGRSS